MNRKKRIETMLKNNFQDWKIKVIDISDQHIGHNKFDGTDESHFCLIIKITDKLNSSRLLIHRKIYRLLTNEFKIGLHALEIKIVT